MLDHLSEHQLKTKLRCLELAIDSQLPINGSDNKVTEAAQKYFDWLTIPVPSRFSVKPTNEEDTIAKKKYHISLKAEGLDQALGETEALQFRKAILKLADNGILVDITYYEIPAKIEKLAT